MGIAACFGRILVIIVKSAKQKLHPVTGDSVYQDSVPQTPTDKKDRASSTMPGLERE